MDPILVVGIAIFTLLIGGGLGWLLSAKVQDSKIAAASSTAEDLRRTLDGVNEELNQAKDHYSTARDERETLSARLAANEAAQAERAKAQDEKLVELKAFNEQSRQQLTEQFSSVGNKLLNEAQEQFLKRADQRFDQANEKGGEKIAKLLQPVHERLATYEASITKIEKERTESYAGITATIEQVRQGQDRVQQEAARLVNSLRNAPKSRGRWGEQQLKNVLETCGLAEHTDFVTEQSVDTDEGRLRPDALINIPGGRKLVIDAKVSLNDYQDAFEADDEEVRRFAMARHCNSMKAHIDGLSKKAYWDQFEDAPDYVIMFVPGEHFLAAALEHEPTLWDHAFEKKVLLATPTNLVAIARTVAGVWRQEKMAAEAKQIGQLGKEMYDRLAVAGEHLKRMGSGLGSAVGNYNKFVGSFERNVMATGRKFAELQIETGKKDLEIVPEIEALPRHSDTMTDKLIEDDRQFKDEALKDEAAE